MSTVWSCNEWDQLEEVIVGNPLNARFPTADLSAQLAEFPDRPVAEIPRGPFPQQIIEETQEDLDGFVKILEGLGIADDRRREGHDAARDAGMQAATSETRAEHLATTIDTISELREQISMSQRAAGLASELTGSGVGRGAS